MNDKLAILSMDIEDWYHLYYFGDRADKSYSMLDGFTNYVELLNKYNIKTTFFVLSELAESIKSELKYAISCGHEIACHGKTHTRPLDFDVVTFRTEIKEAKQQLEDITGCEIFGYRAPCYGIDNERYDVIRELGFKYSSSKMDVKGHPLYGELDLNEFENIRNGIYEKDGMIEFPLSSQEAFGKNIAVSGGGWIRLLPWYPIMKPLVKKYISTSDIYTLYIHPFELSKKPMPKVENTGILTNIRARKGLGKVENRIEQLIIMLHDNGYCFKTFKEICDNLNG